MIKYYLKLMNKLNPWQISFFAALIYGFWAGWVNSDHGSDIALKVGLIQASYAFLSTALVTFIAQKLLEKFNFSSAARVIALLASWVVMLSIPVLLHTWQNTPDLIEAILPGAIIGTLYLGSYCYNSEASPPK